MNDRYLFRGRRTDTGEWVEGYLMDDGFINVPYNDDEAGGRFDDEIEVNPATIGQCTGLRDKNETLIFEGDIVEIVMPLCQSKPITCKSEVFWKPASWCVHWGDGRDELRIDGFAPCVTFEVVGNIYDGREGGAD